MAEWRFHPVRRWRFDYADIPSMVAVEIEGGVFKFGRHNRPVSMVKDAEKYNTAAHLGWTVFRLISSNDPRLDMMTQSHLLPILETMRERRTNGVATVTWMLSDSSTHPHQP